MSCWDFGGDLTGFYEILMDFDGILLVISLDFTGFHGILMVISVVLMVISLDFIGF